MYGRNKYGTGKYGRSDVGVTLSVSVADIIAVATSVKFTINALITNVIVVSTLFRQTITQIVQDIISISTLPVFQAFLKPPLRAIARLINSVRSTCNIKSDSVKGRVRQPENKGMVK